MTVEFNDPSLRELYENNKSTLEINSEMLNKLSSDIKLLDSLLEGKVGNIVTHISLDIPEGGKLVWYGKQIVFEKQEFTLNVRRLLECPKEVRVRCKPYLPKFFKMCLDSIEGVTK